MMEELFHLNDPSPVNTKEAAFCVKTHYANGSKKFFINFCHSSSIPPPTLKLSESELETLIAKSGENDDELKRLSIPLILEKMERTHDKRGNEAAVTHAIMNSEFYRQKVASSNIFKNFVIFVTIETVCSKFGVELAFTPASCVILQNKRAQLPDRQAAFNRFIEPHVEAKIDAQDGENLLNNKFKIEEIENDPQQQQARIEASCSTLTETRSGNNNGNIRITLNLKQDIVDIVIKFIDKIDANQLELLLNDDRILLRHRGDVLHDFHLPIYMRPNEATAMLRNNETILRIECPVRL